MSPDLSLITKFFAIMIQQLSNHVRFHHLNMLKNTCILKLRETLTTRGIDFFSHTLMDGHTHFCSPKTGESSRLNED